MPEEHRDASHPGPATRPVTALVFAGGDPLGRREAVPAHDLVIGADSGVHEALARGLAVDLVVGDLDSISPEALAAVEEAGGRVERHPVDKDATDLELAVDAAARHGARRVVVVGGGGGRLDHLLANLLLLGAPRFAHLAVEARLGGASVTVLHGGGTVHLTGETGDLVSLVPVGGPARGVRTDGLRFGLLDQTLPAGTSRGVSNELCARHATVTLASGTLLVIQPGSSG